jgi:tetraacyldisaccharide 4'-kinase
MQTEPTRNLHNRIRAHWYGDKAAPGFPLTTILDMASGGYGLGIRFQNALYDRGFLPIRRLPVPVVSVGNLTVGGTGKTPLVIHLAELLRDQGKRPAILSRGYGGRPRDPVEVVSDGKRVLCEPIICGDEPFMMARRLREVPVLTGPERFLTGREAVDRFGADVLLLDDGFQHRRLYRDADILLIHARNPFGNGRLLPGGPLREPLTALRRARWVIRTGPKPAAGENEIPPALPGYDRPVLRALHRPSRLVRVADGESLPLDFLEGKKICAFAGIGSPDAFRRTLDLLGCATAAFLAYPDHYRFNREDLGEIRRLAAVGDAAWYVTTEKDAARLAGMENALPELLVLEVDLHMEPDDGGLGQDILDLLEHWSRRRSGEQP